MEIIDMKQGHFYFISDEFFTRFDPNGLLMRNKEGNRSRPCYFVFPDKTEPEIFWCVPISSKVEKYEGIVQKKLEKQERNGNDHPSCDTIRFGNVLGQKRAFLIQNIFPISAQYIDATYIDRNTQKPVTISRKTERDIYLKAKKILRLVWRGYENLVFSDVLSIRAALIQESQREIPFEKRIPMKDRFAMAKETAAQRDTERAGSAPTPKPPKKDDPSLE